MHQVQEDTDFQGVPIHRVLALTPDQNEVLPAVTGESQIDHRRYPMSTRVAMTDHHIQRLQQAVILRGGAQLQQLEQPEQDGSAAGMGWPEQRQVIVLVISGDRGVLAPQGLDTATLFQNVPNPPS